MRTNLSIKAVAFILIIFLAFPILSACGRKITLDDAKYTMGKLFSAVGDGDYEAVAQLMHKSTGVTESKVQSFITRVENRVGASFEDGISNVRYTSYEELPYNGVPGGSKFQVHGTMNIGEVRNIPFIILLAMDSDGYGVYLFDIDGSAI